MKWALGILTGLGVALIVVAGWLAGPSIILIQSGAIATGEIVDIRVLPSRGSGRDLHAPMVQFRAGPRIVRGQLKASSDPVYLKGDRVPLYYAPATPERFVVADFEQMWQRPVIVTCLALALFAAACLVGKAMRGVSEPVIFSLAFRGIGALLLSAAILTAGLQWLELRQSLHTVGTVTNGRGEPWRLFKDSGYRATPAEISFVTTTGGKVAITDFNLDARNQPPNAPVHVYYNLERPHRAKVATFGALWFNSILFGAFGLATLSAGLAVRVLFRT